MASKDSRKAIAAVWGGVPVQRCTVNKHRNLLAHAPERLHEEVTADCKDMIYAATPAVIESRRKAFIRTWRLKCRAAAGSLEEAGDRLFTLHTVAEPVAQHQDHQRDRASARRVQAPDQDADDAAIS
jgi:transposase-like protein